MKTYCWLVIAVFFFGQCSTMDMPGDCLTYRVTTTTSGYQTVDAFSYGGSHHVSSHVSQFGGPGLTTTSFADSYTYDTEGRLVSVKGIEYNSQSTYTYTTGDLPVRLDITYSGRLTEQLVYEYNATNQLIKKTFTYFNPSDTTVAVDSLEYPDVTTRNPSAINHRGSTESRVTYQYDNHPNPMMAIGIVPFSPANNITREDKMYFYFTYNSKGYPTSSVSSDGDKTTWTYGVCR